MQKVENGRLNSYIRLVWRKVFCNKRESSNSCYCADCFLSSLPTSGLCLMTDTLHASCSLQLGICSLTVWSAADLWSVALLLLLFFSVPRHVGVEIRSVKFSVSSAWLTEVFWSFLRHSVLLQSQPPNKPAKMRTVPLSGFSRTGHRYW